MLILAAMPGILTLLVYFLIFCIIVGIIWFCVNKFIPEPVKGWATTVIVVLCGIILILFLLQIVGTGGVKLW